MSKVDRKKLERGKKLVREHVFDPLSAVVTDLNTSGLDAEQLEAQWAPFRLNFSVPYFASDSYGPEFSIPFVLPPLQDTMGFEVVSKAYTDRAGSPQTTKTVHGSVTDTTAPIFLDEVSFGFDQRDMPAAIASQFYENGHGDSADQGKLCFDLISRYDVRLSILEKTPLFFVPPEQRTPEHEVPRREVWSVDIDHTSFANDVFSLNPFVVSGINEQIDPWKSYVFKMSFPGIGGYPWEDLFSDNPAVAFVSIEASLKFRSTVTKRNTRTTWAPDNVPGSTLVKRSRTAAGNPVSITVPAPGDKIKADGAAGVSESIAAVDGAFRSKIYAGFNENTAAGSTVESIAEELDPDSAYEVLTVPLFQNSGVGGVAVDTVQSQPYGNEVNREDSALIDRRVIPINYPIQIEHVVVALNFQPFYMEDKTGAVVSGTIHPSTGPWNISYDFGVGVGTGLQADDFDYAQIARSSGVWRPGNPSPGYDWIIDKIKTAPDKYSPLSGTQRTRNLELWCLPLSTGTSAVDGSSYYYHAGAATSPIGLQSRPVVVGRAWTQTEARTRPLGTRGREQWIEVRGRISGFPAAAVTAADNAIVVGYQGFFVYIIGRKFLAS